MSRVAWDTRFISRAYYVRIIGDKKRKKKRYRERLVYSPCPKAHRRREPYARGRCNLIRTPIRSLSRLTKPPHLVLSYLTSFAVCVECSSVLHPHEICSLAREYILLRAAQISLSLVATALSFLHALSKKERYLLVKYRDIFETLK